MNAPDSLPFDDTDPDAPDEADLPLVLLVDDEVRSQEAMRRTLDEDFRIVASQVLARMIEVLGPGDGTILYTRAPLQLQQFTYEILEQYRPSAPPDKATDEQKYWDRLYPVPEGYKEFKALRAAEKASKDLERGKQEQK